MSQVKIFLLAGKLYASGIMFLCSIGQKKPEALVPLVPV